MSKMAFSRATKKQSRARVALFGPAGSGKTFNAIELALTLGSKVAVVDTERGSAAKYAEGDPFEFDHLPLEDFSPMSYVEAIKLAEREGYDCVVIDSLSHAWEGAGGVLEQVNDKGGRFDSWRSVTPKHNALVEAMLTSKCHIIATMRTKTEYVVEKNEKGKSEPRKIGLSPKQRDDMEYEFDLAGSIEADTSTITITKTRAHGRIEKGSAWRHKTPLLGAKLLEWLKQGKEEAAETQEAAPVSDPKAPAEAAEAQKSPRTKTATDGSSALPAVSSSETPALRVVPSEPHPMVEKAKEVFGLAKPGKDAMVAMAKLAMANKPNGLGWSKPHFANWLKKHFNADGLASLNGQQFQDAEWLLRERLKSEDEYVATLSSLAAIGRCAV